MSLPSTPVFDAPNRYESPNQQSPFATEPSIAAGPPMITMEKMFTQFCSMHQQVLSAFADQAQHPHSNSARQLKIPDIPLFSGKENYLDWETQFFLNAQGHEEFQDKQKVAYTLSRLDSDARKSCAHVCRRGQIVCSNLPTEFF